MTELAPIAVFAFKRPDHTRRALVALAANPEFKRSTLVVYCDGARHEREAPGVVATREVVHRFPHPRKTVVEAADNLGLASSIAQGVTEMCAQFGRVIVLEDDLVVSPAFLGYMNEGLERYANEERVMQIAGHMFPVHLEIETDAVFLPFISSWGWATWKRAWDMYSPGLDGWEAIGSDASVRSRFDLDRSYPYFSMLKRQARGNIDSWAIRWYLSCFRASGMALFPTVSLVANGGFDSLGTNCDAVSASAEQTLLRTTPIRHYPETAVNGAAFDCVKSYLRRENRGLARLARRLRRYLA